MAIKWIVWLMTAAIIALTSLTIACTVLFRFQQGEVFSDDFRHIYALPFLVFVIPRLNPSSDANQRAFTREIREVLRVLSPDDAVDEVGFTFSVRALEWAIDRK